MKDKDHKMLEEAWKQVYVEEPNMSPEEAQEAHGRGETLMVTTADGVEFIVDPHNDDTIEADPQNGLVFMGSDPDGGEVEVRADDISMIKSLSDKESIRGFDPSKSHEAQFQGDEKMARFGKPAAWESVDHEKEEKDDEKKKNSHEWDDRSKKYFKPKKLAQEEDSLEDITEAHWSQMPAAEALHNMKKAIADLEPAGDVREWYVDAVDAGVEEEVLDKILVAAVKSGDLHRAEAHFIKTGSQDHPDQDPSDVGHRGFDQIDDSCGPDNAKTNEEDKIKRVIIKRIKLMKPESTKVQEKQSCPPGYYWCTKDKKCKKKDSHDDEMRAANAQIDNMMPGQDPYS